MQFIYTGFYQELQSLQETYEDADFGFLENETLDTKINAGDFLHGFCNIFAMCLHEIFHYDMQAIYDKNNNLVHAYCVKEHSIHGTIFIDVRGCTNDFHTFISEFEDFITITKDEPINISSIKQFFEPEYTHDAMKLIENYKEYYSVN